MYGVNGHSRIECIMSNRTDGKRDAIIKPVMELMAERGFHRSPKALISKKAGVGTGTIYRYFKNKDVLIEEVFNTIWKENLSVAALKDVIEKAPLAPTLS